MVTLETDRLLLRMFRDDDYESYARICADPEVMRYLAQGTPYTRHESWRHLAFLIGHWQLRGFGHWAVEEKESGRLVGRIGFLEPEGWPGFELGWTLGREFWGRGYATEGARRALRYGYTELSKDEIISLIHPDNAGSIRVAERLGATLAGRADVLGRENLVFRHHKEGHYPKLAAGEA